MTIQDIIVEFFALVCLLVLACVGFLILLFKMKSRDDRKAFSKVLGSNSVKTYYKPEEYAKAAENRSEKSSE